jgi:hypothetical protein
MPTLAIQAIENFGSVVLAVVLMDGGGQAAEVRDRPDPTSYGDGDGERLARWCFAAGSKPITQPTGARDAEIEPARDPRPFELALAFAGLMTSTSNTR